MDTIEKNENVQMINLKRDFKLSPPYFCESSLSRSHSSLTESVTAEVTGTGEEKVKTKQHTTNECLEHRQINLELEEIVMGSEEKLEKSSQIGGADKEKKLKKGPRPTPPPGLKDDLTTISHTCIILFVVLILYACFSKPFEFFTWHPLLLSVGWMFIMTEGVLFISKENPVGRRLNLNRTLKLRYHWIAIVISLVLIFCGFIVVVKTKNDRGKEHFKTLHAIFGLIAIVGCIPSAINGTASLFDVELKRYIKPSLITAIHVASGSVVVTFGGLSLIMSVFTNWFKTHTDNNKYMLMLGLVTTIYVAVWTAQRPWRKTLRKFFNFEI